MAERIFNLRGVPDDEAEELRQYLTDHGADFYETPAGRWGMSSPALWVRDPGRREEVRQLIAQYQSERAARVRDEFAALKAAGQHPTLWRSFRHHPVRFIAVLLGVAFIVYVSVGPFLRMIAR
jgi:hypothetical protein